MSVPLIAAARPLPPFETLFSTSERFTAAVTDHKVILAAIRAQDPAAAREAMQRHLTRVRDAYSRAIDSTA
ncbi:MAG: FCD domain-containing protein [Betaproteobacteria bacterium]|nr:FCD domain-containing protein [Betaproteobacteria bacterium]